MHSSLELGMLFKRSYFIIIDKTINKSPSQIMFQPCTCRNGLSRAPVGRQAPWLFELKLRIRSEIGYQIFGQV